MEDRKLTKKQKAACEAYMNHILQTTGQSSIGDLIGAICKAIEVAENFCEGENGRDNPLEKTPSIKYSSPYKRFLLPD